jgi:hypothetical protein
MAAPARHQRDPRRRELAALHAALRHGRRGAGPAGRHGRPRPAKARANRSPPEPEPAQRTPWQPSARRPPRRRPFGVAYTTLPAQSSDAGTGTTTGAYGP